MLLKSRKLDPSYGHKFSFSRPIFSKCSKYIMSQELSPSINIFETPKLTIMAVWPTGKYHLGFPNPFHYHRNRPFSSLSPCLRCFLISCWRPLGLQSSSHYPIKWNIWQRGASYDVCNVLVLPFVCFYFFAAWLLTLCHCINCIGQGLDL